MNVTALVEADGDVVERVVYDPYGKPKFYDGDWANASDSSAYANEILFGGYRYDTETGLYHVRHRPYHPTLGRWLQRDPIGYADGMSLREYAGGAPTVRIDPAGFYGLDVHYYMTYYLARRCGLVGCKRAMGKSQVDVGESIAWSDQFTDDHPDTAPPQWNRPRPPSRLLHFPQSDLAEKNALRQDRRWADLYGNEPPAWRDSTTSVTRDSYTANGPWRNAKVGPEGGQLFGKGVGLHVIQDSFAHEGTDDAGAGHAVAGNDPDIPVQQPRTAMQMAQRTYVLFGELMKQLGCPPCKCKEAWEDVRPDVEAMFTAAGRGNEEERAQSWQDSMAKQGIVVPAYQQRRGGPGADEFLRQAYEVAPHIRP